MKTGIAACSADLVAALRARGHLVDTYPESAAHDFPWVHRQRPYDLIVYQFGNSSHHDYEWPYAFRYPGLVVLHDTHLHHARAALLLRERRRDEYRHELAWNEPQINPDVAELAVAGFDSGLYYDWPFVRGLVTASRLVAVHGEATRRALIEALSDSRWPMADERPPISKKLVAIRLGHGELVTPEREAEARARIRARYGIEPDAVLFGVFGGLAPEKRVPQVLAAFRAVLPYAPGARLLLAGAPAAHFDLPAAIATLDAAAASRVTVTGYVDDAELTDHIAAVDVSLNLRWPTAGETSGPWLRALAAGKPTVITDLVHLADRPSLDPRTWAVRRSEAGGGKSGDGKDEDAVCIAVDILDEDHSLRLAMRRLATDAALRASLGRAARDTWQREHSVEAMTDDYEGVMREARASAEADESLSQDLRPDGGATLRSLLAPFGLDSPL